MAAGTAADSTAWRPDEYGGPVIVSLALHVLVVVLLATNLSFCEREVVVPEMPAHVRAVVIERRPARVELPEVSRVAIPDVKVSRPEPLPVPAPQESAPAVTGLKPAADVKPPAPARPAAPDFDALLRQDERTSSERSLAREAGREAERRAARAEQDREAGVRARQDARTIDEHKALIAAAIRSKWRRPASARNGMVVELRIELTPGGELRNLQLLKSSGDAVFDRAAENAVRLASPLPVPGDPAVFNAAFRQFAFRFRPEDLAQ